MLEHACIVPKKVTDGLVLSDLGRAWGPTHSARQGLIPWTWTPTPATSSRMSKRPGAIGAVLKHGEGVDGGDGTFFGL